MISKTLTGFLVTCLIGLFAAGASFASEGDADEGEKVWRKCKTCHTLEEGKNRVGPHLACLIGREAGSVEGYRYSDSMKESGLVWDRETLLNYLQNPRDVIQRTKMAFPGLRDEQEVKDLLAYIEKTCEEGGD